MADELRQMLTQDELMERLKISRVTLYRWRKTGLPEIKIGRSVRFDPVAVEKWLHEQSAPNRADGSGR